MFVNMQSVHPQENGPPATELLPARPSLPALKEAAAHCRACDLWRLGTQTVFGEGSAPAELMLVGEQPGDREDREGRPFVGPAGALLDRALADASVARDAVYLTNVVKHFRWEARGKRRLHRKPDPIHVAACRPWLQAEVDVVRPRLLVLMGATAAQALLGSSFRVLRERGHFVPSPLGVTAMATVHPSAVLRAPEDQARRRAYADFVADLRTAAAWLEKAAPRRG
jgi:uracil-DNA glycosylase family protein